MGRRNPFSMLQALKEKPAYNWCQSSWGFLWCGFEIFELAGKGPGRNLDFWGTHAELQRTTPIPHTK